MQRMLYILSEELCALLKVVETVNPQAAVDFDKRFHEKMKKLREEGKKLDDLAATQQAKIQAGLDKQRALLDEKQEIIDEIETTLYEKQALVEKQQVVMDKLKRMLDEKKAELDAREARIAKREAELNLKGMSGRPFEGCNIAEA